MTRQLLVGPFNRVEGDLEVSLTVADGRVAEARVNSPLFRGFEIMLQGKDPRDALTLVPRICGICSISQSAAAAQALAAAAGVTPAPQGALTAALLHGVENLADHLTHFALFFMPDFARPAYSGHDWHAQAVARFTAMRRARPPAPWSRPGRGFCTSSARWAANGRTPSPSSPAASPRPPTPATACASSPRSAPSAGRWRTIFFGAPLEDFATLATLSDLDAWQTGDAGLFLRIARDLHLAELGQGPRRYLSFGAYPQGPARATRAGVWDNGTVTPLDPAAITEDLSHAWMLGDTAHPARGQTIPDEAMRDPAYSWCKAPRLGGRVAEVGALARQALDGHPLGAALAAEGGVRARVAARLLEIARTQIWLEEQAQALDPSASFLTRCDLPREGEGVGLVEAARGGLGHWLRIEGGRIASYQIIAPTTWNFSPRDASGVPGALESALVGAPVGPDEDTPLAVQHIVRSFDPCMVCTVH